MAVNDILVRLVFEEVNLDPARQKIRDLARDLLELEKRPLPGATPAARAANLAEAQRIQTEAINERALAEAARQALLVRKGMLESALASLQAARGAEQMARANLEGAKALQQQTQAQTHSLRLQEEAYEKLLASMALTKSMTGAPHPAEAKTRQLLLNAKQDLGMQLQKQNIIDQQVATYAEQLRLAENAVKQKEEEVNQIKQALATEKERLQIAQEIQKRAETVQTQIAAPATPALSPWQRLQTIWQSFANAFSSKSAAGYNAVMRDISIITRSVGSLAVGTTWQGALYYFSQIGRNLTGISLAAGVAAFAFTSLISAIINLSRRGAAVVAVSDAFYNLARSAGLSSTYLTKQIQEAARGTISYAEIARQSNRALLAGTVDFAEQLPAIMEIARASALATGQDIQFVFQSLITGIARGSPRLIDNADIYLRLGEAMEEYAGKIGKTVNMLTAEERITATLNAVLAQKESYVNRVGLTTTTAADRWQALTVATKDYIDAWGMLLSKRAGIDSFIGWLAERFGNAAASMRDLTDPLYDLYAQRDKTFERLKSISQELLPVEEELIRVEQILADPSLSSNRRAIFDLRKRELEVKVADLRATHELANAEYGAALRAIQAAQARHVLSEEEQRAINIRERLLRAYYALTEDEGRIDWQTQIYQQIGEDVARLRGELAEPLRIPEPIGGARNIEQLFAWAQQVEKLVGEVKEAERPLAAVTAYQQERSKRLRAILDLGDPIKALQEFTRMLQRNNEPLEDLLKNFSAYDAELQRAIRDSRIFIAILDQLAVRRQPYIDVGGLFTAYNTMLERVSDLAKRAVEIGALDLARISTETIAAIREEMKENYERLIYLDEHGIAAWLATRLRGYQDMVTQEEARRNDLIRLRENLITALAQLQMPVVPEMERGLLLNTQALFEYLRLVQQSHPELQQQTAELYNLGVALAQEQQRIAETVMAMQDKEQAMLRLSQTLFGVKAGLLELAQNFSMLPPAIRDSINATQLYTLALRELHQQLQQTITIDKMIETVSAGIDAIIGAGRDLTRHLGVEQALATTRNLVAHYLEEMRQLGEREAAQNKLTWDFYAHTILQNYLDSIQAVRELYDQTGKAARGAARDIKSAIESALKSGVEVTQLDVWETQLGRYADKPLEAARRLQDIVNRGFDSLRENASQNWAEALQIPPEVLAGSEIGLKAWAERTRQQVLALVRPDLINWDAFIAEFKRQLEEEAARELTLDIAYEKLVAADLVQPGTKQRIRQQLEEMFGKPRFSINTYLDTAQTDDVAIQRFLAWQREKAPTTWPIQIELSGQLPQLQSDKWTGPQADIAVVGMQMADQLGNTFIVALAQQQPWIQVANYWSADYQRNNALFQQLGMQVGNQVGEAYIEALRNKASSSRRVLAQAISGELIEILDSRYLRRNPVHDEPFMR